MFGGARRNRTADLLNAIQALSQLSYGPTCRSVWGHCGIARRRSSGVSIVGSDGRFKPLRRLPGRYRSDPTHRRRLPLRPRGKCRRPPSSSTTSISSSEMVPFSASSASTSSSEMSSGPLVSSSASSSSLTAARASDGGCCAAQGHGLEDGAAFRAGRRILVQVVEFRAAAHALALRAEFRFGHG